VRIKDDGTGQCSAYGFTGVARTSVVVDGEGKAKATVLSNEAARSWIEECIMMGRRNGD